MVQKGGEIITRLKRIRLDSGLTQTEMAEQLGVTQSEISLLESGARNPSFKLLLHISKCLGLTMEEVIEKDVD